MYYRTIWQDHIEGVQDGTDMNAANFNNIEAGVMEAAALAAYNSEMTGHRGAVSYGTEDLVAGVSPLKTGSLYFVYE